MTMISDLKQAKIFGHPIHMILVHFPSALLPASMVLDVLGCFTGDVSYSLSAFYTLTGGVWLAVAAAVFGFIDFLHIPQDNSAAKQKAVQHLLMNIVWLSIFGVLWGLRMKEYPSIQAINTVPLIMSILAVGLLSVSNHVGGDLILRHGIGLIRK